MYMMYGCELLLPKKISKNQKKHIIFFQNFTFLVRKVDFVCLQPQVCGTYSKYPQVPLQSAQQETKVALTRHRPVFC